MGTLYVGLDVHKVSISVSVAEDGRDGAVRFLGEVPNTPTDVAKLAKRLAKDGDPLEFCYEAGCCGYGIHRQLTELGHGCMVVAPKLTNSMSTAPCGFSFKVNNDRGVRDEHGHA
ncbi:MAG: hypothetical protein Q8Q88_21255 [Phenylobacterium sp.]|uniref:hypothetical protein n=1 Tax=Phenylobacterium sp. TaxID=1871053 RepID=UPI002736472D|nr:hypothetical protein [Phenylobacterium sp.]MDP3749569.1 hypothetical protein [Phenylobacterium sp.]